MANQTDKNIQLHHLENRIILLGASNLTLSLRLVIHLMQQRLGSPSEVLVASGHGRAYGVFSQMLLRGLPGIVASGLWRQLDVMQLRPSYALLTDIGNDILYGLMPEQILRQMEWCIEQLQQQSAQIVVTNLPMASIESLSKSLYTLFRNIFYPFCRLSKEETLSRARAVYQGLIDMAARRHFKLYEQKPVWLGSDGIHVHYWKRRAFYEDILAQFSLTDNSHMCIQSKEELLLTWQRRSHFAYKTILGREIHCPQPSGRLADGTTIFKY
ncbi:hypothetical protein [Nitrosomonas sp. Nm166]|uniref:hypothetical protein n=1 Tax=Nitrosomonas sp. Nm166 TaxID=1881054 RepID=UPI0008EE18CE|nr:hypothetical protein [Nitrosomonas sp. Nm166]SFE22439.1 hypothetical protein SAMN05428977_10108 [Nitrosomonas sp. Nm166]